LENLYGVSKNHAESLKTPLEFQKSMGIFKNRDGVSKISMEFQYSFETPAFSWSFESPEMVAAVVPPLLAFQNTSLNIQHCIHRNS
jgi:hypothetical protein